MAKHEGSGFGVSPRKSMGMGHGMPSGGNFGVEDHVNAHEGMPSPHKGDGVKPHMEDHERGVGHPIERGKGMMPMQAHPDHGHHHHPSHHSGENHKHGKV